MSNNITTVDPNDRWEPLLTLIQLEEDIEREPRPNSSQQKLLTEIRSLIAEFRRKTSNRERQFSLMTRLFVHLGDEGFLGSPAEESVLVPSGEEENHESNP